MLRLALVLLALPLAGNPCQANDSSAEVAVGGLVMAKTDAIAMQREDLTLAPNQIRVRYEMRNDRTVPVTLHVAFPLPEVPIDTPIGMDIISPDGEIRSHMVSWPLAGGLNDLHFIVSVDGKTIKPEVEIRADLPNGRNVVDALRQIGGWSLVLHPRMYTQDSTLAFYDADRDIGPTRLRELRALGAVRGTDPVWPLWRTHITFHWMQTFKPGVTIVEHRYTPLLGHLLFGWHDGKPDFPEPYRSAKDYCIDDAKSRSLQAMVRPVPLATLSAATLGYIVTPGANWAGPIETFHLLVDSTNSPVPEETVGMVLLCSEVPLQPAGPHRLEGTIHDFTPRKDLKLLMVLQP
jgi:hypothetical protein